jgi:NhaP-type Na+/H+ or K+/H+ antiporter
VQGRLVAWFGIRGVGSIYYLMFAINQGIDAQAAERLIGITLAVVTASIFVHGISVTPLMQAYRRISRRGRRSRARAPSAGSDKQPGSGT